MNRLLSLILLLCLASPMVVHASSLIVVEDRGGVSALPYYQDLAPEPNAQSTQPENIGVRGQGSFPVRSDQLTPGQVQGRVINAPGLQPLFLVGDDESSRTWLSQRREQLQQLHAVGLVVNVASAERFAEVQRWAGDLQIVPAPSNELAQRLGIKHYPLLITATTIQQ
ncbi:integrating conjugative element protein [Pseudomonas tolaasii]|uniref:integrating conjugative element protein n=1 Tax=Pseudomonas tolaasii TaxID=29442 RepID=UPI00037BAFD7|nr:integrating conjugative element protein [Pseudomonas tolaasii]